MMKAFLLVAMAAGPLLPVMVRAQGAAPNFQSQLLDVTGEVAPDEKAAARLGFDDLSIGFGTDSGRMVWIAVVKAEGWGHDGFLGRALLRQVDGYEPNLVAVGKADLVSKLRLAPMGSRVALQGLLDLQSRSYLLGSVAVTPPAAK